MLARATEPHAGDSHAEYHTDLPHRSGQPRGRTCVITLEGGNRQLVDYGPGSANRNACQDQTRQERHPGR